jgi:hypothetical protein
LRDVHGTGLFAVIALGGYAQQLIGDSSMISPDGTSTNLLETILGISNYFSIGPTGLFDEVGLFGTWVPIIDIPT